MEDTSSEIDEKQRLNRTRKELVLIGNFYVQYIKNYKHVTVEMHSTPIHSQNYTNA